MIGDKFAVKNTAQNPPEPQKPSYLEIASRSNNDDATSLLLHLKTPAQAPAELDTKLPGDSKRTSDKVKLLKTQQKTKPSRSTSLPTPAKKKIQLMKKTYCVTRTSPTYLHERMVI